MNENMNTNVVGVPTKRDYAMMYAVRASVEKDGEEVIAFGAPFVALDDDSAILAVRDSINKLVETGVLNKEILKNHNIYRLGRYYFSKRRPCAPVRPLPVKIFNCANFVLDSDKEVDVNE